MSKNQLPPLSDRWGESGRRKARKRRGWNKVPDCLHALLSLYKPMQQIVPSKIQHAHSRSVRSRPARCSDDSRLIPESFPGAACTPWDGPPTQQGGLRVSNVAAMQHDPHGPLPGKRWCYPAADEPARRTNGQDAGTETARLSADTGAGSAIIDTREGAMNRPPSAGSSHRKADTRGLTRPLKPSEPPRRLGSRGRRFPRDSRLTLTASRLAPPDSQV